MKSKKIGNPNNKHVVIGDNNNCSFKFDIEEVDIEYDALTWKNLIIQIHSRIDTEFTVTINVNDVSRGNLNDLIAELTRIRDNVF